MIAIKCMSFRRGEPVVLDRLEYTFTPTSGTQSCVSMLIMTAYSIKVTGYSGQGEKVQGELVNGAGLSCYNILGLPSTDPRKDYFLTFQAGVTHHGYFNRVNDGALSLDLNSIYLSSASFSYINSLTVPTWCRRLTSGTKVAPACANITFVGRSRLQAKEMLVTATGTETTAQFVTQFPNAVCHCTDGDFTPRQLVQEPVLDRLEFDIDGSLQPTFTSFALLLPISVYVVGNGVASTVGGGEQEFSVTTTGVKGTWASFTGISGEQIAAGTKLTRYATFNGQVGLNLSYTLFSTTTASVVTRLVIPTWCNIAGASESKTFINCSDVYFVGRTYEQAVALHSLMTTIFPKAVWHCSDGDFTSQQITQ